MMVSRPNEPSLDLFQLSRIGAQAFSGDARVVGLRAQPAGPGVRIDAVCDGVGLVFWAPEADWCAWLAPQWPIPSLSVLGAELWPLAAAWTLTSLEGLLTQVGLAPCASANLTPAQAPSARHWCLLCETAGRRLPLYILHAPPDWLMAVLEGLQPVSSVLLTVTLGMGWCFAPSVTEARLNVGDAVPVLGATEALDQFWVHPAATPGRVRFLGQNEVEVAEQASSQREGLVGAWSVEVAEIQVAADRLWPWQPGTTFEVQPMVYPLVRLMWAGRPQALGTLLRLTNGWAVRLDRLRGAAPASAQR